MESRIRDLEDEIKREENESTHLITNKENEIRQLKEELSKIVIEYDDLMASKTDLEVEIRTYRRLLEGEENRYVTNYAHLIRIPVLIYDVLFF